MKLIIYFWYKLYYNTMNKILFCLLGIAMLSVSCKTQKTPINETIVEMTSGSIDFRFDARFHEATTIVVDWGDGESTVYNIEEPKFRTYEHSYKTSGEHKIVIKGNSKSIQGLNFNYSYLTSLNISKASGLWWLRVAHTHLKTVDVSKNRELRAIYAAKSNIEYLDISNNPKMEELHCWSSPLVQNQSAMVKLANSMRVNNSESPCKIYLSADSDAISWIRVICDEKGWTINTDLVG